MICYDSDSGRIFFNAITIMQFKSFRKFTFFLILCFDATRDPNRDTLAEPPMPISDTNYCMFLHRLSNVSVRPTAFSG